jgi:acetolactate decarboxylase
MRIATSFALILVFALIFNAGLGAQEPPPQDQGPQGRDVLYQASTIDALSRGNFDGEITVEKLKRHGDFGLGAMDQLDGELVVLDGQAWRIGTDGLPHLLPDTARLSFAAVTSFEPDHVIAIQDQANFQALGERLDLELLSRNYFQAIKITGTFTRIRVRSVPKQTAPYGKLADAIANQVTFDLENVRGAMVGWRCPDFVAGFNVAGYHFHFLTEDKKAGGHVLEVNLFSAVAEIDTTRDLYIALPRNDQYRNTNFLE